MIFKTFHNIEVPENIENIRNPRRGWYRIFPFTLGETWDPIQTESSLVKEDVLVLVEILLPNRKLKGDTNVAQWLRQVFSFFQERGYDMMLRFSYDFEGKGYERDPDEDVVLENIEPLLDIVNEYASHVFLIQGITVGSWGEMHSSRYLTKEYIRKFLEKIQWHMYPDIFRSVRKPFFWRMICKENEWEKMEDEKIGLYNDGILGSPTDLGTFSEENPQRGEGIGEKYTWEEPWPKKKELPLLEENAYYAPVGGEVVAAEKKNSPDEMRTYFQKLHLTYLNRDYDGKELNRWKKLDCGEDGIWKGKSFYEYVEAHLGYRFVIRKVRWKRKGNAKFLHLEICNTGFSCPYGKMYAMIVEEYQEKRKIIAREKLSTIRCHEYKELVVELSKGKEREGKTKIYAVLAEENSDRRFFYANLSDEQGRVLLYEY